MRSLQNRIEKVEEQIGISTKRLVILLVGGSGRFMSEFFHTIEEESWYVNWRCKQVADNHLSQGSECVFILDTEDIKKHITEFRNLSHMESANTTTDGNPIMRFEKTLADKYGIKSGITDE